MCWAQGHPAGQSLRPVWSLNSSSFTQLVRGQETCNSLPTRLGEDVVGGDPSLPGSANQEPVRSSRGLLPASWVQVGGRGWGGGRMGRQGPCAHWGEWKWGLGAGWVSGKGRLQTQQQ